MTNFNRVQGDTGDTVTAFLYGLASYVGSATVAHVWQTGVTATTLTATVADGFDDSTPAKACGVCTVHLASWITNATPGDWLLEYQTTFSDNTVVTHPDENPDTLHVRAQGA